MLVPWGFCCEQSFDTGIAPGSRRFACSNCDAVATILPCCTEDAFQCAVCFHVNVGVAYDPTTECPPRPSDMGPASVVCKNDGTTLYMKWFGPLAHEICDLCYTLYYYDSGPLTVQRTRVP